LVTYPPDPLPLIKGRGSVGKRGAKPLSKISSPSPLKERGIKGVRLINNHRKPLPFSARIRGKGIILYTLMGK